MSVIHGIIAFRFQHIFEIKKVDIVELEEGHEGDLFWKALDGKTDYGSLQDGKTRFTVILVQSCDLYISSLNRIKSLFPG